jgi:hypothetical protein
VVAVHRQSKGGERKTDAKIWAAAEEYTRLIEARDRSVMDFYGLGVTRQLQVFVFHDFTEIPKLAGPVQAKAEANPFVLIETFVAASKLDKRLTHKQRVENVAEAIQLAWQDSQNEEIL